MLSKQGGNKRTTSCAIPVARATNAVEVLAQCTSYVGNMLTDVVGDLHDQDGRTKVWNTWVDRHGI